MAPWPLYHLIDGGMEMGGPSVTASGLIFIAATSDGYMRAFDIDTGGELWQHELPTTGNAVPMTYTYQGRQYLVIAAGGHFTSPLPAGDHLVAFRLPE
jgi:quinoprotein glucose dehydrogenase